MKTVFCIFSDIHSAEFALEKIIKAGFSELHMNAIVQEVVAKEYLNISNPQTMTQKGEQSGKHQLNVLSSIFTGKHGINTPDAGRVLAGGTIATEIAGTASVKTGGGFTVTLKDFGIPDTYATQYIRGIIAGGVLFIIKTEDTKTGDAIQILNESKGKGIYNTPPIKPAF